MLANVVVPYFGVGDFSNETHSCRICFDEPGDGEMRRYRGQPLQWNESASYDAVDHCKNVVSLASALLRETPSIPYAII